MHENRGVSPTMVLDHLQARGLAVDFQSTDPLSQLTPQMVGQLTPSKWVNWPPSWDLWPQGDQLTHSERSDEGGGQLTNIGKEAVGEISGREGGGVGSVDHHWEHSGSIGSRGLVGSVDQPFVGSVDQGGQLTGYHKSCICCFNQLHSEKKILF